MVFPTCYAGPCRKEAVLGAIRSDIYMQSEFHDRERKEKLEPQSAKKRYSVVYGSKAYRSELRRWS